MEPETLPHWSGVIEQTVKPRAVPLTTTAGWRLVQYAGRALGWLAVAGLLSWAAVSAVQLFDESPGTGTPVGTSATVDHIEVVTDGVLAPDWVQQTLRLRPGIRMLELDLPALRDRLQAVPQIRAAVLTRRFPSTLLVHLEERTPVARLRAAGPDGEVLDLLVDREGVPFEPIGSDPLLHQRLPYLAGVSLTRTARGAFRPIDGMPAVAAFLFQAGELAPHLVRDWQAIDLSRLPLLLLRSREVAEIVIDPSDPAPQLARLDYILDHARRLGDGRLERVDLSVGADVPVVPRPGSPLLRPALAAAGSGPASPPLRNGAPRRLSPSRSSP